MHTKTKRWRPCCLLTKVSKKKSDSETASVARGLSIPRRILSSAKDLDQVYESDVGFCRQ